MQLLTKLEELILLSVWRLQDGAYGKTIYQLLVNVTGKKLSLGGVYFPLDRLVKKGLIATFIGNPTDDRRGLSKRYYSLTSEGMLALEELNGVNEQMWQGFPEVSSKVSKQEQ